MGLIPSELIALDLRWARKAMPLASCDEVRLMTMHKVRYASREVPTELRHASGDWLRLRGLHSHTGEVLLPTGELP